MYAATIAAILIIFGTVLIIVSINTDNALTVSVAAWIVVTGSVICLALMVVIFAYSNISIFTGFCNYFFTLLFTTCASRKNMV